MCIRDSHHLTLCSPQSVELGDHQCLALLKGYQCRPELLSFVGRDGAAHLLAEHLLTPRLPQDDELLVEGLPLSTDSGVTPC